MKTQVKVKKNTFVDFLKILKIEIKLQLTPIKLIVAFIIALIPLINPLASSPDDYGTIRETWGYLGRVFSESVTYAFFIRLNSILVDRFSRDKNRAEYIVYPTFLILMAKSIVDVFLFIAIILFSLIGSISIIYFLKDGKIRDDFFENCLTFIIGIGLWYLFIASFLRLIMSNNKWKNLTKVILGVIFIFLTFVTYTTFSIIIGVIKNSVTGVGVNGKKINFYEYPVSNFFNDNREWASFVPFLNFGYIPMILYQQFPGNNQYHLMPGNCWYKIIGIYPKFKNGTKEAHSLLSLKKLETGYS